MVKVTIAEREIPLAFNMDAWCLMDDEVCRLADIDSVLNNDRPGKSKGLGSKKKFISLLRIIGNAGLACADLKPDLTDEWLRKNIMPMQYAALQYAVIQAIDKGMGMETAEKKEGEPRDLVLEEINKKKR